MTEAYILLTGGHTGLGLGVTKKLLKPEDKIGLIVRNESRKQATQSELNGFSIADTNAFKLTADLINRRII